MLEVRDIQFFPDGRSIVDTMGGRRFKVIERGVMDGYNTAKVEFLEDEKVPEDQVQGGWKFNSKSKIQILNCDLFRLKTCSRQFRENPLFSCTIWIT